MSDKPDIIILSSIRWDDPNSGPGIAFAKELSKTRRVFFVDRPFTVKDLVSEVSSYSIRKRLRALVLRKDPFLEVNAGDSRFVVATPGLTLPINFLPSELLFRFFNVFNNWVVHRSILRMARTYDIKSYVYLNYFLPTLVPTLHLKHAHCLLNMYYVSQDIRLTKYVSRHGTIAEQRLLAKTELVLVSSRNLFQLLYHKHSNVHYFPNAVDYAFFERSRISAIPRPFDLMYVGDTPVIMFVGYMSRIRFDYRLLSLICDAFPSCLVIAIGNYEAEDVAEHQLQQIKNLILMGNRRFESIPSYLKCATVTIIPYLCNDLNRNVYPVKLNEYISMGKPVVSTRFSPDLENFSEVIHIADNYREFLDAIELSLNTKEDEMEQHRLNMAETNNWSNRVKFLDALIDAKINPKT